MIALEANPKSLLPFITALFYRPYLHSFFFPSCSGSSEKILYFISSSLDSRASNRTRFKANSFALEAHDQETANLESRLCRCSGSNEFRSGRFWTYLWEENMDDFNQDLFAGVCLAGDSGSHGKHQPENGHHQKWYDARIPHERHTRSKQTTTNIFLGTDETQTPVHHKAPVVLFNNQDPALHRHGHASLNSFVPSRVHREAPPAFSGSARQRLCHNAANPHLENSPESLITKTSASINAARQMSMPNDGQHHVNDSEQPPVETSRLHSTADAMSSLVTEASSDDLDNALHTAQSESAAIETPNPIAKSLMSRSWNPSAMTEEARSDSRSKHQAEVRMPRTCSAPPGGPRGGHTSREDTLGGSAMAELLQSSISKTFQPGSRSRELPVIGQQTNHVRRATDSQTLRNIQYPNIAQGSSDVIISNDTSRPTIVSARRNVPPTVDAPERADFQPSTNLLASPNTLPISSAMSALQDLKGRMAQGVKSLSFCETIINKVQAELQLVDKLRDRRLSIETHSTAISNDHCPLSLTTHSADLSRNYRLDAGALVASNALSKIDIALVDTPKANEIIFSSTSRPTTPCPPTSVRTIGPHQSNQSHPASAADPAAQINSLIGSLDAAVAADLSGLTHPDYLDHQCKPKYLSRISAFHVADHDPRYPQTSEVLNSGEAAIAAIRNSSSHFSRPLIPGHEGTIATSSCWPDSSQATISCLNNNSPDRNFSVSALHSQSIRPYMTSTRSQPSGSPQLHSSQRNKAPDSANALFGTQQLDYPWQAVISQLLIRLLVLDPCTLSNC